MYTSSTNRTARRFGVRQVAFCCATIISLCIGLAFARQINSFSISNPFSGSGQKIVDSLGSFSDAARERKERPLYVVPESIIRGKVSGQTAYGVANRPFTVGEAKKNYDGAPQQSENIVLKNGQYVFEASVKGAANIRIQQAGLIKPTPASITILLPAPTHDSTIKEKSPPSVQNTGRGFLAKLGQSVGNATSPDHALQELHSYLVAEQAKDTELHEAAACWAIQSVVDIVRPLIENDVVEIVPPGYKPAPTPLIKNPYKLTVEKQPVILNVGVWAPRSSVVGPPNVQFTEANCQSILTASSAQPGAASGQELVNVATLTGRTVSKVNLGS